MTSEINQIMIELSDRELIEAIQERYSAYPHEALGAGLEEVKRRGLKCDDGAAQAYLARPVPKKFVQTEPAAVPTYSCPKCDVPMYRGRSYLQGTAMGFAIFGMSYKHLYFESRESGECVVVVENSESRSAFRCSACGLTVIES